MSATSPLGALDDRSVDKLLERAASPAAASGGAAAVPAPPGSPGSAVRANAAANTAASPASPLASIAGQLTAAESLPPLPPAAAAAPPAVPPGAAAPAEAARRRRNTSVSLAASESGGGGGSGGSRTAELYGFLGWQLTRASLLVYLAWAWVPEAALHWVGVVHYPDRYWALAPPATLLIIVMFYTTVYGLFGMASNPPLTSSNALSDGYSRRAPLPAPLPGAAPTAPPLFSKGGQAATAVAARTRAVGAGGWPLGASLGSSAPAAAKTAVDDGSGGARLGSFGHVALARYGAWLDACEDALDAYAPAATAALRAVAHAKAAAAWRPQSPQRLALRAHSSRRRVRSCPPQFAASSSSAAVATGGRSAVAASAAAASASASAAAAASASAAAAVSKRSRGGSLTYEPPPRRAPAASATGAWRARRAPLQRLDEPGLGGGEAAPVRAPAPRTWLLPSGLSRRMHIPDIYDLPVTMANRLQFLAPLLPRYARRRAEAVTTFISA